MVFQNHSLLPWLTRWGNGDLAVERVFAKRETKAQLAARTDAALAMVGLTHAAQKAPRRNIGRYEAARGHCACALSMGRASAADG